MAAVKKRKSQRMSKNKLIISLCIIVLVAIFLTMGLAGNKAKTILIPFHGSFYTFYYPEDWTVNQNDRRDINGTEFLLEPPDQAQSESPHVTIDAAPATQKATSKLLDPFTNFHYEKTESSVHGFQAQKFTRIGHAGEGSLHATAYFFRANGNIYLIALEDKQEAPDTQLENDFNQIVKTFTPQ